MPDPTPTVSYSPDRLRALVLDWCEANGLHQSDAARRAGMSPSQFADLTSGRKPNPGVVTVARVLDAIGKRWADLDRSASTTPRAGR
jgi:transcriptional regulator with XRE-family HTH domain